MAYVKKKKRKKKVPITKAVRKKKKSKISVSIKRGRPAKKKKATAARRRKTKVKIGPDLNTLWCITRHEEQEESNKIRVFINGAWLEPYLEMEDVEYFFNDKESAESALAMMPHDDSDIGLQEPAIVEPASKHLMVHYYFREDKHEQTGVLPRWRIVPYGEGVSIKKAVKAARNSFLAEIKNIEKDKKLAIKRVNKEVKELSAETKHVIRDLKYFVKQTKKYG